MAKPASGVVVKWHIGTFNESRKRWAAIPAVMRGEEDEVHLLKPPCALWDRSEGCFVLSHDPNALDHFLGWVASRRDVARLVEHSKAADELLRRHRL